MKHSGTLAPFIIGLATLLFTISCGMNGGFESTLPLETEIINESAIVIGTPSETLVATDPVDFLITYPDDTNPASITLNVMDISIGGTAPTDCTVSSVVGAGLTRTVTVEQCSGTGTANISIAAGTATTTLGISIGAAGPSTTFVVDNSGPTTPSGVTLGSVPNNLTDTPTITFSGSTDIGGSYVAEYGVRIIKTSDSSVVLDWTTHVSGDDVTGLSLLSNTQYSVLVRAFDEFGNASASSTAASWTTATIAAGPCGASPSPGDVCTGGAIYMGSLSPGATSGSGTDYYMTTPGGCDEIPAGQRVGSGNTAYPNADFTPVCSGTDDLEKLWSDGSMNYYDIPGVDTYTGTEGTTNGLINTDTHYGSDNTSLIAAITAPAEGGYHPAARYCDKLVYGGYSDWYLPNRYELNLMFMNRASLPGISTGSWYWSSTEYGNAGAWDQRFSDGYQLRSGVNKDFSLELVRCVRRF